MTAQTENAADRYAPVDFYVRREQKTKDGNMAEAGIIVISYFVFVAALPIYVSFEIYHLIRRKELIVTPFRIGIMSGIIFGIIAIYYEVVTSHGESGLVAAALSPFVLLGFVFSGALVAWFYKRRNKPFCSLLIRKLKGH